MRHSRDRPLRGVSGLVRRQPLTVEHNWQQPAKSAVAHYQQVMKFQGTMQKIRQLEAIYFKLCFKLRFDFSDDLACTRCVEWAVERLGLDEEGDDLEIGLLASARNLDEVFPLVEIIVERYLGVDRLDDQLAAGKYIVALRHAYLEGKETVHSIDIRLTQLYPQLGYPGWLGMLSRNCEYATDVPAFEEPFEKEFSYISALWADSDNRADFDERYDPKTSQGHDFNPA